MEVILGAGITSNESSSSSDGNGGSSDGYNLQPQDPIVYESGLEASTYINNEEDVAKTVDKALLTA